MVSLNAGKAIPKLCPPPQWAVKVGFPRPASKLGRAAAAHPLLRKWPPTKIAHPNADNTARRPTIIPVVKPRRENFDCPKAASVRRPSNTPAVFVISRPPPPAAGKPQLPRTNSHQNVPPTPLAAQVWPCAWLCADPWLCAGLLTPHPLCAGLLTSCARVSRPRTPGSAPGFPCSPLPPHRTRHSTLATKYHYCKSFQYLVEKSHPPC